MKSIKKVIGFGLLTWFVPFIMAFAFYSPDGEIWIGQDLFKSVMIVVASLVGSLLLVRYFKSVQSSYLKEGVNIGLVWLAINLALDIIILLPMSKMAFDQYIAQIGLRYLVIPIMGTTFGLLLEQANNQKK
jgi:hypothetical protein